MSTAEISYTQSKTLNLLLKQQVITKIDNSKETRENSIINLQQTIKLNDQETLNKFQDKITENEIFFDKCDDIRLQLGNIQLEESSATDHYKTLCESYDLLENLLDHILQHVECVILETKTSYKLTAILNEFATHESRQDTLKLENNEEFSDMEVLQEIKNKLYNAMNKYEKISAIRQEYERKKKDYHLALKNFKIILEVMDIKELCLEKLKNQFHDVVVGCRKSRTVLTQEMPYVMAERIEMLGDVLIHLGDGNKKLIAKNMNLIDTMINLGTKMKSSRGRINV